MAKTREPIPKATKEQVLSEFNHRCAICAADRPHLHHIDENPSHNDPQNLIPLCPNHHLTDQHNPTRSIDPDKLQFFRAHKDPVILWPQFHPLFTRMRFLDDIRDDTANLPQYVNDLINFVAELEMGGYYSKKLRSVMPNVPQRQHFSGTMTAENVRRFSERATVQLGEEQQEYRETLRNIREQVHELVVELLRYQRWEKPTDGR